MNTKTKTIGIAIAASVILPGCTIQQICFPDFQDCPGEETGGEEAEGAAWCMQNPMVPDQPIRAFCYPIEQPQPEGYIETACAARFDFTSWNYDGTFHDDNGCEPSPRVTSICFDQGQAGSMSMKTPMDMSVGLCWEDAISNGDSYPSLYISTEYQDDQMHEPLCAPQVHVSELGPLCRYNRGTVCLSHNLFCACACESDADCDYPTVCEGGEPGAEIPTFCVAPFA